MRSDNSALPEHGGASIKPGEDVIDFSANLNPLGMPENVRAALVSSVEEWERYPDPDCAELTKLLAERLGVIPENIVCGNGADDLIFRITGAVRPKKALIAAPCFSEYGKALIEAGAAVREYHLSEENGFMVGGGLLNAVREQLSEGDMLILASPNNPTGRIIPRELLGDICGECEKRGVVFLCDECFLEFAENAVGAGEFQNPCVITLSAFTKTYAMAGLRLGYAVFGSERLADTVRRRGQYWSVSAPAQAAGAAALHSGNYLERARELISEQRKFLTERLSALGITVFPSDANFLLLKTDIPLYKGLCERGIIVRRCGNFGGLDGRFYRIAVRTAAENAQLLAAIKEIVYG